MLTFRLIMRYILAVFFIVAGVAHFLRPAFYIGIMPDYIPYHEAMVYISGVTEIIAGVLILTPRGVWLGGIGIIAMLVAFLPVHIDMIINSQNFPEIPPPVLWIRLILQFVLIYVAWWCAVNPYRKQRGFGQS